MNILAVIVKDAVLPKNCMTCFKWSGLEGGGVSCDLSGKRINFRDENQRHPDCPLTTATQYAERAQ